MMPPQLYIQMEVDEKDQNLFLMKTLGDEDYTIPYWNFIAPVDEQSIQRLYIQKLMLNVPYMSDDVQGHTKK